MVVLWVLGLILMLFISVCMSGSLCLCDDVCGLCQCLWLLIVIMIVLLLWLSTMFIGCCVSVWLCLIVFCSVLLVVIVMFWMMVGVVLLVVS